MNPRSVPDRMIDQVLSGLRDAPVPTDMENRVLQHLEASQAESSARWRIWPPQLHRWLIPCTALAMAACFAVLLGLHPRNTAERTAQTSPLERNAPQPSFDKKMPVQVETPHAKRTGVVRVNHAIARNLARSSNEEDALMQDMLAPSQPAPELPLTRQERMLMLLSRRGEEEQVAIVTPISLPFTNPAEDREFRKFFERQPLPLTTQPAADAAPTTKENGEHQ